MREGDIAISVVEAAVIVLCSHNCSPIETPFSDADAAFRESSQAPTFLMPSTEEVSILCYGCMSFRQYCAFN